MSSGSATTSVSRHLSVSLQVAWNATGRAWFLAAWLCILGFATIPFDLQILPWLSRETVPGELRVLLTRAEPFGHGYGVAFILMTLWVVQRPRRNQMIFLIVASFGAGVVADLIKLFVARIRPVLLPKDADSTFVGLQWTSDFDGIRSVLDTAGHSFPSAHSATAFGLAFALSSLYPRGRVWFYTLASLVAIHRVVYGYHYVSDTFVGASLGIAIGIVAMKKILFSARPSTLAQVDR